MLGVIGWEEMRWDKVEVGRRYDAVGCLFLTDAITKDFRAEVQPGVTILIAWHIGRPICMH